jgi:hypothetical protein
MKERALNSITHVHSLSLTAAPRAKHQLIPQFRERLKFSSQPRGSFGLTRVGARVLCGSYEAGLREA